MITHPIESYWIPSQKMTKSKLQILKIRQNFKFIKFWNGHYTRHTIWSCLIRCANMKWIRWVLLKIQSGHDSVHRWTDRQTDKVIPVYPPINFVEAWGITTVYETISTWQRGQEAGASVFQYHLKIFLLGCNRNRTVQVQWYPWSFHQLHFTCYCYFEIWENYHYFFL